MLMSLDLGLRIPSEYHQTFRSEPSTDLSHNRPSKLVMDSANLFPTYRGHAAPQERLMSIRFSAKAGSKGLKDV